MPRYRTLHQWDGPDEKHWWFVQKQDEKGRWHSISESFSSESQEEAEGLFDKHMKQSEEVVNEWEM